MITLGPHRFSRNDALVTLRELDDLVEGVLRGRSVPAADALLAPVRERIATVSDRFDALDDEALAEIVAPAWEALLRLGPIAREAGLLPPTTAGTVAHLAVSAGGVPKTSVDAVEIGWSGVIGDVQGNRRHHGRPFQALCLWSTEVIDDLRSEGHPIHPGAAGENVTLSGLPWHLVVPGARLAIGSVLCEISGDATPCSKNARWFVGGDFRRMGIDRGPVSRMYATVLRPGRVAVGDTAVLEPPEEEP
jgi:MOSC domain-containing protein YiiM